MHDAFFARSALRLRHRRPAQSCVSPQQPPHVLCPRLRSDDNIRRQPNTLWPRTSGTRAPSFARIDAGRSNVGRYGDRDAARTTCARAAARASAGADRANAVRTGW